MIPKCSVCKDSSDTEARLLESECMPGARYIACSDCRENKREPRPLVVLGVRYGNARKSGQHIKYHLYLGEEITASEIIR